MKTFNELQEDLKVFYQNAITNPYRQTGDVSLLAGYADILCDISHTLAVMCWDPAMKNFRDCADINHTLNSWWTLLHKGVMSPTMKKFIEAMLCTVKTYLNTGEIPEFCNTVFVVREPEKRRLAALDKFVLVTHDMTGLKTPFLPCYYPTEHELITDDLVIQNYIWSSFEYPKDKKEQAFQFWKSKEKPVLQWVNDRFPKTDSHLHHDAWRSLIGTKRDGKY